MPSTTSSVVSRPFASSTVMTPSLPTFSIASAIMSPIVRSPLAETVPTCAISSRPFVSFEAFLAPSVKIARASTVAVVVPSPATSEVFDATSFTICAPMFSNLSLSSISFATVTPSLVTVGAPQDFSITTFRPRGPRVTVTASARTFTPRSTLARASSPNRTTFAAIARLLRFDHAEDVLLAEDQMLLAVELDFVARVLAEQHPIALLDVGRQDLAVFAPAGPDGHDQPLLGLLLGRVRDDDPSGAALLALLDPLHDHPIQQRAHTRRHSLNPPMTLLLPTGRGPAGAATT